MIYHRPEIGNYYDIEDDDMAYALYLHDNDIYEKVMEEIEEMEKIDDIVYYEYMEIVGIYDYDEVERIVDEYLGEW